MPALTTYHLIALPCVLALGPVIADRELGGAASWAVIVTCFGVGTIIGAVLSLRLRVERPMFACVVCFLAAACQPIIIGFAGSTGAIAAFELLAGIGVSAGFTLWETTLGREIPPGSLSRVTSLDWFTTAGAMPLGFAAVAGVAAALGTRTTMLASSLVVLALLVRRAGGRRRAAAAGPRGDAGLAGDRAHVGAQQPHQVRGGDPDLQPAAAAADPDGVEDLDQLVDEGRQLAALPERADAAGDVARDLLRPVGRASATRLPSARVSSWAAAGTRQTVRLPSRSTTRVLKTVSGSRPSASAASSA